MRGSPTNRLSSGAPREQRQRNDFYSALCSAALLFLALSLHVPPGVFGCGASPQDHDFIVIKCLFSRISLFLFPSETGTEGTGGLALCFVLTVK